MFSCSSDQPSIHQRERTSKKLAGVTRLEQATSAVTGQRSCTPILRESWEITVNLSSAPIKGAAEGQPPRILLGIHVLTEWKLMEDELARWQRELESRVAKQKAQLLADADQRKRLEAEIAGAVEGDQERIGQELHDGLAQELTGIEMMLDALDRKLRKPWPAAGARGYITKGEASDNLLDAVRQVLRVKPFISKLATRQRQEIAGQCTGASCR